MENTCPNGANLKPGNPAKCPLKGTCAAANCDVTEFYH